MNKDYLPFYNSLNDKDKAFWMECTKEELIDHLISNIKNGEELLLRIEKSTKYLMIHANYIEDIGRCCDELNDDECTELLDLLLGSDKE